MTTVFAVALLNRKSRLPVRTGSSSYVSWKVVTRAMIQNSWQGDWSDASAFRTVKSIGLIQSRPARRLKNLSSRDFVFCFGLGVKERT